MFFHLFKMTDSIEMHKFTTSNDYQKIETDIRKLSVSDISSFILNGWHLNQSGHWRQFGSSEGTVDNRIFETAT